MGGAGFASQFSAIEAAPSHTPPSTSADDQGTEESSEARNEGGSDENEIRYWDLSDYDGIELDVDGGDGKTYTFILRDEVEQQEKRDDGREKAGVSWEVEFLAHSSDGGKVSREVGETGGGARVWMPWSGFKATYRGKEIESPEPLRVGRIRRVAVMMRR